MPASNSEARKRAEQLGRDAAQSMLDGLAGRIKKATDYARERHSAPANPVIERVLQWAQDRSVVDAWSLDQIERNPREVVAHLAVLLGEVRRLRDIETLTAESEPATERPERLDTLSVQPGDVIVARVDRNTSLQTKRVVKSEFARLFPDNDVLVTAADVSVLHPEPKRTCALCGASPPVGSASVTPQRGDVARGPQGNPEWWPLCHPDGNELPDCYVLWTVYGRRPNK